MSKTPLDVAISRFCGSVPVSYDFPLGGTSSIPLDIELQLLDALADSTVEGRQDIESVARSLSTNDSYSMAIFAVRMAVYALRTDSRSHLSASLIGIAMDEDQLDWRDVLVALSLIRECGVRLSLNMDAVLSKVAEIATPARQHTIREGFLSRPDSIKSIGAMGYVATGVGREVGFVKK